MFATVESTFDVDRWLYLCFIPNRTHPPELTVAGNVLRKSIS